MTITSCTWQMSICGDTCQPKKKKREKDSVRGIGRKPSIYSMLGYTVTGLPTHLPYVPLTILDPPPHCLSVPGKTHAAARHVSCLSCPCTLFSPLQTRFILLLLCLFSLMIIMTPCIHIHTHTYVILFFFFSPVVHVALRVCLPAGSCYLIRQTGVRRHR